MSPADEARAALERASKEYDRDIERWELAVAQVWATLAVAEAIKDGFASTMYTGKS